MWDPGLTTETWDFLMRLGFLGVCLGLPAVILTRTLWAIERILEVVERVEERLGED